MIFQLTLPLWMYPVADLLNLYPIAFLSFVFPLGRFAWDN